jgi:hypothetical protein
LLQESFFFFLGRERCLLVVWFSDLGYYQRLVISFAGLFVAGFFLLLLLLLRDKKDGLWRSKQARRRGTCLLYTHSSSRVELVRRG